MHQYVPNQQQLSIDQVHSGSWKQKIVFLDQLSQQVKLQQLSLSPQLLENIWLDLIRENNFNVLQKAISTLKPWVEVYGVKSIRVQRELVKTLIGLSKMGRSTIDESIVSIVITLFSRQTQEGVNKHRKPLALIDSFNFNSSNNPTFFGGFEQSDPTEEQILNQEEIEPEKTPQPSFILGMIIESMKTCQKHSFAICLKIVSSLMEKSLLTSRQKEEILGQVKKINQVIEHRRVSASDADPKEKKLDEKISLLVVEMSKYEQ